MAFANSALEEGSQQMSTVNMIPNRVYGVRWLPK